MLKKHVFGSFNLNKSEKQRLSFEDIFLGTLDTYTKKNEPTLGSSGGGGGCTVRSAGSQPTCYALLIAIDNINTVCEIGLLLINVWLDLFTIP